MIDYKDTMGKEFTVGDIIVHGQGSYADISIGIVTKLNPIKLQVNGTGSATPQQSLIITELYKKDYPSAYDALYQRFKDKLDLSTTKVRPKLRYAVMVAKMENSEVVKLVVVNYEDGRPTIPLSSLGDFKSYGTRNLERKPKSRYGSALTDELYLSSSSYGNSNRWQLPAKLVRNVLGGVPTDSEVVATFRNMEECKDHLKLNGVTV